MTMNNVRTLPFIPPPPQKKSETCRKRKRVLDFDEEDTKPGISNLIFELHQQLVIQFESLRTNSEKTMLIRLAESFAEMSPRDRETILHVAEKMVER